MMPGPLIFNCERSIKVYEQTLEFVAGSGFENDIEAVGWARHAMTDLIPHTAENLWSGHFFPSEESWNEAQVSTTLAFFGLYKQAMVSLRMSLELGLLSVYWNLFDDGHEVIQEWVHSREDTPRFAEIWDRLRRHPNFEDFQARYDIRSRLLDLGYLHDYVHSKGHRYSNYMGLLKSNHQTFEEEALNQWFASYREVAEVLAILHLVKYPIGTVRYDFSRKFGIDTPMFGGLNLLQVDRLEELVGADVFAILELIASRDVHTQELKAEIEAMPDMTPEEVDDQIRGFDKRDIEQMGVDLWLEQEQKLIDSVPDDDAKERMTSRMNELADWGRRQGFDKPAWERE